MKRHHMAQMDIMDERARSTGTQVSWDVRMQLAELHVLTPDTKDAYIYIYIGVGIKIGAASTWLVPFWV